MRHSRPKDTRRCVVILTLAAVARLPTGSAGADPRDSLDMVCDIFATRVPVPVERLDPYVPDEGYAMQPPGPVAVVQAVAGHCSFPAEKRSGMDYSLMMSPLDEPAGGAYDFWEFSDSSLWHEINASFGKYHDLVPGITFEREMIGGQTVAAHQAVPWPHSPYRMDAVVTPGAPVPRDLRSPSDHWFRGSRGDAHRHDDNFGFEAYGAVVTIETAPGSELAILLGADRLTSPGAFLHFEARCTWRITSL